jgi:agmatinase
MAGHGSPRRYPAASKGFLDLPVSKSGFKASRVHVLPVPYEATVSYGTGAREGPRAIIQASAQVELYDPDFNGEPALDWGVCTLPPLRVGLRTPERMMESVARAAEPVIRCGKLLLALGGEHSITPAVLRGVRRAIGEPLTVVQIDAHADLRESYLKERYSHACAMRRVLEENPGPCVQIGIRSYSSEEADFIRESGGRLTLFPASMFARGNPAALYRRIRRAVNGRKVYLTIDVDGLDPSVIPATGTPEPGGLTWQQAVETVKTVCESAEIVAMDCVELAPAPGLHMAEFAAARLLYKALCFAMRRR